MSKDILRQMAAVQARLNQACDAVFQIEGGHRTVLQTSMDYPKHPAVVEMKKIAKELQDLKGQLAPGFRYIKG